MTTRLKIKISLFFIFIISLILIPACGNRKSPTGGPIDNEKPEVVNVTPNPFEQIENNQISITFSKQMDQSSILSGLQIYPRVLNKKYVWKNNTLTIIFKEKLKDDTNYYINLTSLVKCSHGNSLEKPISYTFKNGRLNLLKISGEFSYEDISDKSALKRTILLDQDSLLIMESNTVENSIIFEYLNEQPIILKSYIDKNKNNSYDSNSEPYYQTTIQPDYKHALQIKLAYADTLKPDIKQIKPLSKNDIEVIFTEKLHHVPYTFFYSEKSSTALYIVASELKDNTIHYITSDMDTTKYNVLIKQIHDLKENVSDAKEGFMQGTFAELKDNPAIISSSIRNGVAISDTKPTILIKFSQIMLKDNVQFSLTETETNKTIPMIAINTNSSEWKFSPEQVLKPFNSYVFKIFKSSHNHQDKTLENDFEVSFIVKDKKK